MRIQTVQVRNVRLFLFLIGHIFPPEIQSDHILRDSDILDYVNIVYVQLFDDYIRLYIRTILCN